MYKLETKLNRALREKAINNPLLDNSRETFAFKIELDAGDYKSFDYLKQGYAITDENGISINPTNKFCTYLNGILIVNESNVEGVESPILTFSTSLEILVPLRTIDEESDTMELVGSIRDILDDTLSVNEYGAFDGYNMGISYSLAGTGQRGLKLKIGDCISLYCYITFSFVANGVNSTEYVVTIDDVTLETQRKGFSRASVLDTEIASDSENGEAGAIQGNTVFTLNFDKPVQKTDIDTWIMDYVFNGNNPVRTVRITVPIKNGNIISVKKMIFSESMQNTDTTLNASETITMVEALE